MSVRRQDRDINVTHNRTNRTKTPRGLETAVFLVASAVGIYGLGRGLTGFYERGQQISLLWLAVTGIAFFVLFAQMGRVHDAWPRRPEKTVSRTPNAEAMPGDVSPAADRK